MIGPQNKLELSVYLVLSAVVILACGFVDTAWSQESQDKSPLNAGDAHFYSVSDLPYNPDPELQLLHARIADPQRWPASFYSLADGGRCTSSLVGPRVLMTAAHCVGNGKIARISKAGRMYRGTCTHAPDYDPVTQSTADWALCLLNQEVPGVPFEVVNDKAEHLVEGGELLLTGFGCIQSDGSGGNDGIYRIGESTIQRLPRENDHDIITRGGAALCYGDSGGPAFHFLDPERTKRVIVSVNSRGNIQDTSYLSSVTVEPARNFFLEWSRTHGVHICGLHGQATGCRH